jgi:hypothetical protein
MAAPARPEKDERRAGKPDDFLVECMIVCINDVLRKRCGKMKRRSTLAAYSSFSCP